MKPTAAKESVEVRDPGEIEIGIEDVKARSVRGIVVLTGRTFFLQIIAVVASGFMWAYLGPKELGIFFILNAVINFLNYFSDIGLAAALIQKKNHPTETDLKTTFFVQELLVVGIIGIVVAFTPYLTQHYSLDRDGVILLYALALSFFLSSLKSIPSILLERKLDFIKLTFPQILEQVVYYVILVILAIQGYGIRSFTIAVIVRDIVGLVSIYWLQPWKPGFAFSKETLKDLFKFGIPYQVNTLLAAFKDDGMTIILGGILGPAGVGFLGTAQKFARYPLTFFMDTVTRVTFPAFSRMQDSPDHLARSVTRSIFFICFLVFPSLVGLAILAPYIVELIPRYNQWKPALIALTFVSINFMFAAATTQLTNLLNAIGKIKITFFLMIMWTALTWALIPFLATKFGADGAALGYALVGSSSIVAIFIAKKYVDFSLYHSIGKPLLGTAIMATVMLIIKMFLPVTTYTMLILMLVGAVVYGVVMVVIVGASLVEDAKKSFKTVIGK